ncbi:PREDICTED: high choriolytic enzyme 1-like, partial [Wasmannia auropunctata]|uniref:high choriolytic enzyme 1-like n=1 Tax=Wasmannia auropunctata TaxID=64793 RepID=UPI0005EED127
KDQLNVIQAAMNEYHNKTCIRFKERTNEKDYVNIVNNRTGCSSPIGRQGGEQLVNFQTPNCLNVNRTGIATHEFMHTLGFWHEHSREDRDGYVDINTNNIQK